VGASVSVIRESDDLDRFKPARQPEPVLTIGERRFTVRRARLAPAMISTPGHRASRRRQRGAVPAWSLSALAGRCPAMPG
jgi:hypothetical protein